MSRRNIYYWKCDRPQAFHGTKTRGEFSTENEIQLRESIKRELGAQIVEMSPGPGQGNHLTWNAHVDGKAMFIRVENGPEKDEHLAVESVVLNRVREIGVMTPKVFGCDATRSGLPFAWQALEQVAAPDLNHWFKQGVLDVPGVAFEIGQAVAKWQTISPQGFGTLDSSARPEAQGNPGVGEEGRLPLEGSRRSYADYFHLRLDEHLDFLVSNGFLARKQKADIIAEIATHKGLLDVTQGCLVHKDLALWNILGTSQKIASFIDFDDAVSGDPMDDLSLLACFHDASFLESAFTGYASIRPLPADWLRRFWLHLLRNMIVKAVIRVGAGYFDRSEGFFLIPHGASGGTLREWTHARMNTALNGLRSGCGLETL
jgi:fructosamine-3-kinase